MIKKAALVIFTFSALVGAHLLYVQGFAAVAEHLARTDGPDEPPIDLPSDSAQRSERLAVENFGTGHWTTQKKIKLQYYDQARGSYMYGMDYELSNNGKTMKVRPFAMISLSKDGKGHKTVTSEEAIVDMNQPFGLLTKPSKDAPQKVTHARLIGKVMIRDDKGTPDSKDDLRIGPLTQPVDYDEPTMQITSDSVVVILDQDMVTEGTGLTIQLRQKAPAPREPGAPPAKTNGGMGSGFEAKTIILRKNVHIVSSNVGTGGALMGRSQPDAQGNTPLNLWCTGEMKADLPESPRPPAPPAPGAPAAPMVPEAPPAPTYVRFNQNVRVIRGVLQRGRGDQLDQLNCDTLDLTLRPDPKPSKPTSGPGTIVAATKTGVGAPDGPAALPVIAAAGAADAPVAAPTAEERADRQAGKGSLSGLKLRTALARGHNVWVQSESQGLKARCTELHYDKLLDEGKPDRTYLNAGANRKIFVEKVNLVAEGQPNAGSVKELMRLKSADATIFDHGEGQSTIVARGPGEFEQRPNASESITQRGWFEDRMQLWNYRDATPAVVAVDKAAPTPVANLNPLRRRVTLTGTPKLEDAKSGATLDAREQIVAEFEPIPQAPGAAPTASSKPTDGATRIKWLKGYEDVHLTTPNRTLTAYRTFEAVFLHPEPAPGAAPTAPAPGALALAGPAATPGAAPAPARNPASGALALASPAPNTASASASAPTLPEAQPDAPPPAPEGAIDGRANHVTAWVLQTPGTSKSEIQRAILQSDVVVHQDPAPGERSGRDVRGDRVEVDAQGKGLMRFTVEPLDPHATLPEPKTRLASTSRTPTHRNGLNPGTARVEFDGKTIESNGLLGLDQQRNFAWCDGPGTLYQQADRGFFDDKGLDSDRSKPKGKTSASGTPTPRDAMVATWNDEMRFYGHSVDKFGRPAAKVELLGESRRMSTADGRQENRRGAVAKLTNSAVFADRLDVYFDRTINLSKPSTPNGVKAPAEPQAEMALVEAWGENSPEGSDWEYKGVDVISRKFFEGTQILMEKQRIMHTHVIYNKRTGDYECAGPGRVLLYQGKLPAKDKDAVGLRTGPKAQRVASGGTPTVKLTEVTFTELMQGRFGVARDGVEATTRTGNFTGNVQAVNGIVANEGQAFDFDQLEHWPDAVFLSSDVLQVRNEPIADGAKGSSKSLLIAQGNAITRTVDRTIQGDRITHNTADDESYIYADNGKFISVAEQRSAGQVVNTTRGTAARYNTKTRAFQLVDPTNIVAYDLKTGTRPKATFPPDEGGTMGKAPGLARKRQQQIRTQRSSPERKGFSSGQ